MDSFARKLGYMDSSSFMRAMRRRGYRLHSNNPPDPSSPSQQDISRQVVLDIALEKAQSETKYYKRLYKESIRKRTLQETAVAAIREVAAMVPSIKVNSYRIRSVGREDRGSETDILQLSDLHGGELVNSDETMGIGEFNMEILNKRLDFLFQKVLELVEIRRSSLHIPNLMVAELGDMLSGDIHHELEVTNIDYMMNLAVRIAFLISQGLAQIAPHFENVEIECVPGNHPRLQKEVSYKGRYINWDYLCYQWQAVLCSAVDNVHFHIPKSPFRLTQIENTRALLYHGSEIKSWGGVPWYGIERAAARFREMLQAQNKYFDILLLAHFHRNAQIPQATGPIIVNSSLKGGDEFSITSMQSAMPPSQNLVLIHNKNGYIGGWPIYLKEADKKNDLGFKDFLPEVWDELKSEIK